uniref:ATP synthase subunit C n=1 Tax=Okeania sp. SIO2F4 TaxID=2607790 RepID=UPI0025D6271E|nr:ATP synthase subunit C [Okeania sp. SIO2F4]
MVRVILYRWLRGDRQCHRLYHRRTGSHWCHDQLKGGYGRFVGLSALPSSMSIYGIVVMFALNRPTIAPEAAGGLFGIGLGAGLGFLLTAVYQGLACASAIAAAKDKAEIFGLALAPAAIVEGFAVFALVLGQGIPQ